MNKPEVTNIEQLKSFLVKSERGGFVLKFCRGEGKCTAKNRTIRQLPCPDCYQPSEAATLGEVADALNKGDA